MELHLQNPEMLWGLPLVLLLGWLMLRKKRRLNTRFTYRHVILSLVAFSLCLLGLARPQMGRQVSTRKTGGSNVFLAVDISRSMLASDIRPSRLQFVTSSLQILSDSLANSRVALFAFAADGYLQVPLTSDLDGLLTITPTLSPNMTTDQGTDLSRSMQTLFSQIAKLEGKAKRRGEAWFPSQVILFSDGETHHELSKDIFRKFNTKNIPIHTVGTGTLSGGPIPVQQFRFRAGRTRTLRDNRGKTIVTKLNPEPLKEISQITGGTYYPADLNAMTSLGTRLQQRGRSAQISTQIQVDKEYYPLLFALALAFFLLEFGLGRWEYAIRSGLVFLFISSTASANENNTGKLIEQLEKATDPEVRSTLTYNLGVAYSKEKNLQKAVEYFQEAAYLTQDEALKKKSLFNLGNSWLYLQDPKKAIESYQSAYDINTESNEFNKNTNTKLSENIALAHRILQQAQKGAQSNQQQNDKSGSSPKDNKGPKKNYKKERFSEERKRRIFDLMAREEQQTIQRLQRKQSKKAAPKPQVKQW